VSVGAVVFARLGRRQSIVSRRFVAHNIALHRRASGCIGLQTHVRFGRMWAEKGEGRRLGTRLLRVIQLCAVLGAVAKLGPRMRSERHRVAVGLALSAEECWQTTAGRSWSDGIG
jgi:hypothetical protein